MSPIWNILGNGKKPAPESAQVTFFTIGETGTFDRHVAGCYQCRNITDFRTLLALFREKAAAHPDRTVFATLDDYGQACYTSGHTRDANLLDTDDEIDLGAYHDTEHPPGDPATAEHHATLFRLMHRNLLSKAEGLSFADLAGRIDWRHPDSPGFAALNANPNMALDYRGEHYLLLVPVPHPAEAICAFPNGYFHGDLSPMENLVLARHLHGYGYRPLGIGASYVGFIRDQPLSDEAARRLAMDILSIHRNVDTADELENVTATLKANDWLLLFYNDN